MLISVFIGFSALNSMRCRITIRQQTNLALTVHNLDACIFFLKPEKPTINHPEKQSDSHSSVVEFDYKKFAFNRAHVWFFVRTASRK